ncbi:Metallophosphoesterase OS=Tsukamurella paurometabola (strain ATCC 8368 / DSM / CCUG 35730 /CIP 100753 / JCM 10117 / KCTC 9821 / NBRC 16120 / NCIMB 702349/ NCTC 13040) OX=521096 GN=Tpau_0483 PE=4 SV=1 [Tsukamurella paurometabola]|uniref:Metallophosphoesterase n=1 Tax=Tsukamurella paurometabola (strain ATCC 8368 / DSM 20162 / CCUG 35730 / CIP 100753 / JCM 10117 / KCTC 9821 / NBRC 16120 / NCIMB 702349 / NCTC 13040) TaxID=521096 RepID=D5US57_TSUPD|nr:polynucleotide kinase-phosphatase [Tsukamurella paurometabola]ADG77124.1 metallophosphoesterase [Tsukamurella paurometabola DSM 20162]SUP42865.1 Bis(5'-nucleosyl)-tetraphosphatase prpE [asymmetrical] [Tsukamurella paurometabola]
MPDTTVAVPARGLILLVGASGSGKSTFAREHFRATEVVSSDVCRGLVADDENDQSATPDAFDLLHHLVGIRLRRGLLTVVDATNVQRPARASLVQLARDHDVLVDAIVFDLPDEIAVERNRQRPDRNFGSQVVTRQGREMRKSLRGIKKEGFRRVHTLHTPDEVAAVEITRERPWNDRTELTGPFDVIGDVHGCAAELRTLLTELGWTVRADGAEHPDGRTAVFVGDLVDRGPDTPAVLRLVMGMVDAGTALCVSGNHEAKLVRALKGNRVTVAHGLQESLDQLAAETEEFRTAATRFMDGLLSHYVLDRGRLVVAHAGLKQEYQGRASRRVRAFALYGDTTGETDEFGLPVRYPWARDYRGSAAVVYGHTPVTEPQWLNNTLCIDTGAVFGGALTGLRYPEREIVSVPAQSQWYEPARPEQVEQSDDRAGSVLRYDDVAGTRWLSTRTGGRVKVDAEGAAAALEVMSRFAVDPRWLIYLPPTMSPASVSRHEDYLEHPVCAFDDFAGWGVERVICEEKHMGSRAIAVIARDADVAAWRFGVADGSSGAVYTRTGRSFVEDSASLVDRIRGAVAPLFDRLDTEWLALDCEILPWSAKAEGLIVDQYASVGAAAREALPVALAGLDAAAARGLDVAGLRARTVRRQVNAVAFRDAYAAYCRPIDGLDGVTVAPFQVLAAEGRVLATESHEWHLDLMGALEDPFLTHTRHRIVDLSSEADRAAAERWWTGLTDAGGEGMVVKPLGATGRKVQPGLKVRGRDYLRIIYGPDYVDSLDVLRDRNLGRKRKMALAEHALGMDALASFVAGEPLWRVHQSVFAVLAQDSEPVDPRL